MAEVPGHILKFNSIGRTLQVDLGVRCYPRQSYGLSEDSPSNFKNSHSLTAKDGYIYRHDDTPGFANLSQKKYLSLHHPSPQDTVHDTKHTSLSHHRKKGLLSEFLDKNAWFAPVCPLMGYQRQFRSARKTQILNPKIRDGPKNTLNGMQTIKNRSNDLKMQTILIMGEKSKIRSKRNALAEKQIPLQTIGVRRMLQTAEQWNTQTNHQIEASPGVSLEDWYKTACSTKKWTYAHKKDQEDL